MMDRTFIDHVIQWQKCINCGSNCRLPPSYSVVLAPRRLLLCVLIRTTLHGERSPSNEEVIAANFKDLDGLPNSSMKKPSKYQGSFGHFVSFLEGDYA